MSKKTRDYIFLIFIICFILGTISVSLYASGYKLNPSWPPKFNRLLIKTGMISLKTSPNGATIYLNSKPQTYFSLNPWRKEYLTTDTKIKNVLPGEYDLTLELEGYWPLTKKIRVYSGQTTFVEDVNLFRSDLPLLVTATAATDLKLSASQKYLYLDGSQKIITIKSGLERTIGTSTSPKGEWLSNNDEVLMNGQLYSPDGNSDIDYSRLIGSTASNWYLDENNQRLFYGNKNTISYLDISKKTSSLVLSGDNYLTYEPRDDYLFLVSENKGHHSLKKYSLKNQKTEQEVSLPDIGHYSLARDGQKLLTLYDDQNHTLYLFNPENISLNPKIFKNVISWQWIDSETIAYNNDWEIYTYDLKRDSVSLLTRFGEEIMQILWNKSNNYLIFSTANSLYAYDLKLGISTRIFQAEKIGSPILDNKSDTLFFWGKIGETTGVYKLQLQ